MCFHYFRINIICLNSSPSTDHKTLHLQLYKNTVELSVYFIVKRNGDLNGKKLFGVIRSPTCQTSFYEHTSV